MASLARLIGSPALTPLLGYVARPHTDPEAECVALAEDLATVEKAPGGAIVLLSRSASADAASYRFDMALRRARGRAVAALVLSGADIARVTPTAAAVADRSGTAILGAADGVDLADLAIAISRELAGDAGTALLRAHTALRGIEAHPRDGDVERLIARAGAALGVPLVRVDAEPAGVARAPVVVDDRVEAWLTATHQEGDLALAVDIVLHAAAAAAARAIATARRAEESPMASRSEVLTELLAAPPHGRGQLVQRARDLGIPIDAWHVAVRLDFEELADASAESRRDAYEARHGVGAAALRAVHRLGGTWHSARAGTAVVLVRMYQDDPGVGASAELAGGMAGVVTGLRPRLPTTLVHCGVGSPHEGPGGLVASVAEAKAAATAARTSGRTNTPVPYDSVGLKRALVEWYASDVARDAVTTVLAPLLELEGARSERLIKTLHVYLDERGSLSKAAETLNLHRNAVGYRINQIFEMLEVDRDNADDLLLLQLACRARELS